MPALGGTDLLRHWSARACVRWQRWPCGEGGMHALLVELGLELGEAPVMVGG